MFAWNINFLIKVKCIIYSKHREQTDDGNEFHNHINLSTVVHVEALLKCHHYTTI